MTHQAIVIHVSSLRPKSRGFTLIEIMVVASITVLLASILVVNFSRSRIDLIQASVLAADAVREAQSLALSGTVRGELRCGYGVRFRPDGYDVYAGPEISGGCGSPTFGNGSDIIRAATLGSQVLTIVGTHDIFFEPPIPTTYVNGDSGFREEDITICRIGTEDCRTITLNASGAISTSK